MASDFPGKPLRTQIVEAAPYAATDAIAIDAETRAERRTRAWQLAVVSVLLSALFVLFLLPVQSPKVATDDDRLEAGRDKDPSAAATSSPATRGAPRVGAREAARDHLGRTLSRFDDLVQRAAEQWARTEMHAARTLIADGERAYRETRYADAERAYAAAEARLETIVEGLPAAVERLVERGQLALAQGDSAQASDAFSRALTLAPDSLPARDGFARAASLDHALALVQQGRGFEDLEEIDKALAAYREALELDTEVPGAANAIQRIEMAQRETRFNRAMSNGFEAISRQAFDEAERAFNRARAQDSNSPQLAQALADLETARTARAIDTALSSGRKASADEDWARAAAAFDRALKLDDALIDAREGRKQARRRRDLDRQLRTHLADRLGLVATARHNDARATLERARAETSPGPRLRGQIEALERALTLARTPLDVGLRSNLATRVTIEGVGELGRFELHTVRLLPGTYVAIGRRDGFHEVRVEFSVSHDQPTSTIVVECKNPALPDANPS